MTQLPLSPVEEWIKKVSELPAQSDDAQMMAVKAMAAVLSKDPDQKQIQRTLGHFEVELSISRQFDQDKTDFNSDTMNHILDGLPFILRKLAAEIKESGEISTETQIAVTLPAISNESDGEVDGASRDSSLVSLTQANEDDGVNGEYGDYFPFSALPDELIGHTFSFLSIKDRMRARVDKRLNKIESEYKYYVEKLEIREESERFIESYIRGTNCIYFIQGKSYSSDCIKRLTHNLSVGYLHIDLKGTSDFHREVYNISNDFDIGTLNLEFSNEQFENEMIVDSFFLDLSKACKELELWRIDNITPNALHQLYKMMMEGSTKLRKLRVEEWNKQITPFFELIGITHRDNRFFTNRDIEGLESHNDDYDEVYARLFDGNLEIYIYHYLYDYDENDTSIWTSGRFSLKFHDSKESLDEVKRALIEEGYEKIEFVRE